MARKASFGPKAKSDPWLYKDGDIVHATANGQCFECDKDGARIENDQGEAKARHWLVNDCVAYVVKRVTPSPKFMHSWRDGTGQLVVKDPEPVYMIQVLPDRDLQPGQNQRMLHFPLGAFFLVCEKALSQTDRDRKLMAHKVFDFDRQQVWKDRIKGFREQVQVDEMREKGSGHRADDR